MTHFRRWVRWLGLPLLGLLLVVALGVDTGSALAQDQPPGPFPPEDLPQPTPPPDPALPPPPDAPPLPEDPMEPIGPPEDPDLFDIPGQINSATHSFFARMVEIGLRIVVALLSATILSTPDLTGSEHIRGMWTAMLVIANLFYVLFIVAGGFVVSARETLQTQYGPKEILPRIVIAGLASNLSLLVLGQAISVVNALTQAISRNVVPDGAGAALAETWDRAAEQTGVNIISLLLGLVIVLLALVVLVTYIIRISVMVVLIISAPIVLLFHALPQTEQLAFLWWRALAGCFAIQFGQTITLVAAIGVFLFPFGPTILGIPISGHGWLALLVAITMLWLMIKIPVWVKEYLWLNSRGIFRRLLFAYFLLRTMGAATSSRARRGGRGRPGRDGRQRSGGPKPKPTPGGPGSRPGPGPGPKPQPGPRRPSSPRPTEQPGPGGSIPGGHRPGTAAPGAGADGPQVREPGGGNPDAGRSRHHDPTTGAGRPGPAAPAGGSAPGTRPAAGQRTTAPRQQPKAGGSTETPVRLRTADRSAPGPKAASRRSTEPGKPGQGQPRSPAGDTRQPRSTATPRRATTGGAQPPVRPKVTPPVRWPTTREVSR